MGNDSKLLFTDDHAKMRHFMPVSGWLILAASVGSLLFAFIMQYQFDIQPCVLCLWQRLPFFVTALLALVVCWWHPYGVHTRIIFILCSLIFFVGTSLAIFHTGIEQHWWLGTSGCVVPSLDGSVTQNFKTRLLQAFGSCDQISWTLFGLSLTNWNIPFSLGLAIFSLAVAKGRSLR